MKNVPMVVAVIVLLLMSLAVTFSPPITVRAVEAEVLRMMALVAVIFWSWGRMLNG